MEARDILMILMGMAVGMAIMHTMEDVAYWWKLRKLRKFAETEDKDNFDG